ncbi:unnamed protein product [Ectocarpus sp. 4 AP-2014]
MERSSLIEITPRARATRRRMACGLRPALLSLAGLASAAALLVILNGSSRTVPTTTGASAAAAAHLLGGKRSSRGEGGGGGGGDRGRRAHGEKLGATDGGGVAAREGKGRQHPHGAGSSRSRKLDVTIGFSEETGRPLVEGDDGVLFDEPPVLRQPIKDEWVQRCSNLENATAAFAHGSVCGPPLSEPCFDHSRCVASTRPMIYVYDQECSLADSNKLRINDHTNLDKQHQGSYWREAVWRAGMLANTYEEACLFIHVNTHNHDEPCATRAPLWNGGVNHIMMEFTPWWIKTQRARPHISNTYAMDWSFDALSCYYRSGYDLSLPLVPGKVFPNTAPSPAPDRDYFLTFKGTLYLRGYGLEERSAVSRVHDPANGVVSVIKCSNMHGDENLPENQDYCQRSRKRYDLYDYDQLMNTTFALVPAGRSPGSFRLGEIMSAGAIPVFVVRDWIKPFQEQIDWPSFSFVFSPDDVGPIMMETLRAVEPAQLLEMQRKSLRAYWKIFGGVTNYSVIASNAIDALIQRIGYH